MGYGYPMNLSEQQLVDCDPYHSGYSQISANPSSIINALQSGPVSIAVNTVDSFMSYSSGVYVSNSCGGYPNHAIMTVGYGNEGGYDYWIVRNSWGSSWGQGGYAYVYRGA